jgi:hypothetical protein
MRGFSKNLSAAIISLTLIAMLIAVGPAKAAIIGITILDDFLIIGESANFVASVEVEQGEFLNLENLTLSITGPQNFTCSFLPDGTIIGSCPAVQIQKVQDAEFGYGYGYGYGYGFVSGVLKYNITLNTSAIQPGEYSAKLSALTLKQEFTSKKEVKFIVGESTPTEKCSLRADAGLIFLNNTQFNSPSTKLNLYVPEKRATNGEGYITAQQGKERMIYKFQVDHSIRPTKSTVLIYTSGTLKNGSKKKVPETAIILYNSNSSKINVDGKLLDISNMSVTFSKC